jgi:uncharacterized protein DUF5994
MKFDRETYETPTGRPPAQNTSRAGRPSPENHEPARVAVAEALFEGSLDGAWWPRSRDVTTQLPSLLAALPERVGRITRVSLNLLMWDSQPRRVPTATGLLKVGWFRAIDRDLIALSDAEGHRTLLAVVPPETATDIAERALSEASGSESRTPAQVLAAAAITTAASPAVVAQAAPESTERNSS